MNKKILATHPPQRRVAFDGKLQLTPIDQTRLSSHKAQKTETYKRLTENDLKEACQVLADSFGDPIKGEPVMRSVINTIPQAAKVLADDWKIVLAPVFKDPNSIIIGAIVKNPDGTDKIVGVNVAHTLDPDPTDSPLVTFGLLGKMLWEIIVGGYCCCTESPTWPWIQVLSYFQEVHNLGVKHLFEGDPTKSIELLFSGVHPDYQGRGFGDKLWTQTEQAAQKMGYTHIWSEVSSPGSYHIASKHNYELKGIAPFKTPGIFMPNPNVGETIALLLRGSADKGTIKTYVKRFGVSTPAMTFKNLSEQATYTKSLPQSTDGQIDGGLALMCKKLQKEASN